MQKKEENKDKSHIVNAYSALLGTIMVVLLSFQINQTTSMFNILTEKTDKQEEKIAILQQDVAVIKAFYMADRGCDDKTKNANTIELGMLPDNKLTTKKIK